MKLLLDTHIWLWTLVSPEKLDANVLQTLENADNALYLSIASSWEIAVKYAIGKLPLPEPPHLFIPMRLQRDGILTLSITHAHACHTARLPGIHRDPFDRLLIAQAILEKMILVTADRQLAQYDVQTLPQQHPADARRF